jgi:hypothetical protein
MLTPERFASAALGLFEVQMAFFTSMVHATVDAGTTAAGQQADALQVQLATASAASRQWLEVGTPAGTAVRGPTTWYRVRPN